MSRGTGAAGVTLAVASAGLALSMFDQTATVVTLHQMGLDFGVGAALRQWVLAAYLLPLAALAPVGGFLADRHGRRRIFVIGALMFALASLACALSPGIWVMIAARAVQGAGAAIMVPAAVALVATNSPAERRTEYIGWMVSIGAVFLSLGPLLGGVLTSGLGWRWVYVVVVPVALAAVALSFRVPESRDAGPGSLDAVGIGLLVAGLGGLVLGFQSLGPDGLEAPQFLAPLILGVLALAAYGRHQARHPHPVLPLRLFRIREVGASATVVFTANFASLAATIYIAMLLEIALGWATWLVGVALLPSVVPAVLLGGFAGRVADRRGPRLPTSLAVLMLAIGMAGLAVGSYMASYAVMFVPLLVVGIAKPFALTVMNAVAVGAVPPGERGVTAGFMATARNAGGAAGACVVGALVAMFAGAGEADYPRGVGVGLSVVVLAALTALLVAWLRLPSRHAADRADDAAAAGTLALSSHSTGDAHTGR